MSTVNEGVGNPRGPKGWLPKNTVLQLFLSIFHNTTWGPARIQTRSRTQRGALLCGKRLAAIPMRRKRPIREPQFESMPGSRRLGPHRGIRISNLFELLTLRSKQAEITVPPSLLLQIGFARSH
jgi:hypothetical protein